MTLLNKFLELKTPEEDNAKVFNAITLDKFSFAKIGINNEGFPVILISSVIDHTSFSLKNVRLKYIELTHNVECKVSENRTSKFDYFSIIVFKSELLNLISYFLGIAETLLNSLSKNPTQKEVFETFKNFVDIFSSLSDAPTKTLQGLWSELLLIDVAKNPKCLLDYWHNHPNEKFDFNADSEKLEVKSSSRLDRVHIFSSEQLYADEDKQILIASVFTRQTTNGKSIINLIESIQIKSPENCFSEKLYSIVSKTLGNSFEQSLRIKYDYDLAVNSLKFYRHQDISKIEELNIPERVFEVKYKSDLTETPSIIPNTIINAGVLFNSI